MIGSATCRSGVSQRQYRDSCGNTTWKNEGTACTASYNCSNISSTSGTESPCTYSCVYSGTQSGSGSTTSAAESAAKAKCSCSKTYSYTRSCSGSCSGSEDGCSYTGTYTGGGTGTGSSCSAAQSAAGSCTCGNKTYTYNLSQAASQSQCTSYCTGAGYDYGTVGSSQTVVGTGSSCSYAKNQASSNWTDYFNSYPSRFCTCGNNTPTTCWSVTIQSVEFSPDNSGEWVGSVHVRYSYTNTCGSQKTTYITWSGSPENPGSCASSGKAVTPVPTGSGTTTGTTSFPCDMLNDSMNVGLSPRSGN